MKNSTFCLLVLNVFAAATLAAEQQIGFMIVLSFWWLALAIYFVYNND